MRRAFLIAVVVIIGCDRSDSVAPPPAAPPPATKPQAEVYPYPVIVADSAHLMLDEHKSDKPYLVEAGKGLVLDAHSFQFTDPQRQARMPNVVQVLYEKSEFSADWSEKGKRVVMLDQTTLHCLKGNNFTGFAPGERAFVAVGYRSPEATGPAEFTPFWVGSVLFR